ncbi:MAG: hypothetical protein LBG74_07180 [Spirochaetaceae bacterium]|jgi:hypothetical protein|nr:hypothetical protein [Spirochaetaceae bacterium]
MKRGAICAAGAFVTSFLLGLLFQADIIIVLLRAFFFAALFFGLIFGASYLIEKLLLDVPLPPQAGIDITVGDEDIEAGQFSDEQQDDGFKTDGSFGAEFDMSDEELGLAGDGLSPSQPADNEGWENDGGGEPQIDNISALFDDAPAQPQTGTPQPLAGGPQPVAGGPKPAPSPERAESYSDFSSFVPGMPGVEKVESEGSAAGGFSSNSEMDSVFSGINLQSGAERAAGGSERGGRVTVGTAEMSMGKPKDEIDFSGHDGKKMAGAIQTLLRKDNE